MDNTHLLQENKCLYCACDITRDLNNYTIHCIVYNIIYYNILYIYLYKGFVKHKYHAIRLPCKVMNIVILRVISRVTVILTTGPIYTYIYIYIYIYIYVYICICIFSYTSVGINSPHPSKLSIPQ